MSSQLRVNILYNKSSQYGIKHDVEVINRLIEKYRQEKNKAEINIKHVDLREPPIKCDIQFHLEVPVFSAIPWSQTNIIIVNPEHWSYSYDDYIQFFDAVVFKDNMSLNRFKDELHKKGQQCNNFYIVPWMSNWTCENNKYSPEDKDNGFVCFIGGSKNKHDYIKQLLPFWKSSDPKLNIYTTREDFENELKKIDLPENVHVKKEDLSDEKVRSISEHFFGHIICSKGEGFGYSASNSECVGAFSIMNDIPVFEDMYNNTCNGEMCGIAWLSNKYICSDNVRYSYGDINCDLVRKQLDGAFRNFYECDINEVSVHRKGLFNKREKDTRMQFNKLFDDMIELYSKRIMASKDNNVPPILKIEDCPPITIITPTYDRLRLFDIALHNILMTDYPRDKIEWIVVEDADSSGNIDKMVGQKLMNFQMNVPKLSIKYIPLLGRASIGEKRNIGIEHATKDIILFMDDDDHYPSTSFRRRVAWLLYGKRKGVAGANIACCTTLALYDLNKGISAVNVPPWDIPFSQRISEATLTFKKSVWESRKFNDISIAEGESWISGRESEVIEIPPQQIIVAFTHGNNKSSRRIPESDGPPSCFWGFPKEYLQFIHGLAGVRVIE